MNIQRDLSADRTIRLIGLLALAFGSHATAQTLVTLYGVADGGVRFDRTSIGTLRSAISGGQSASRWGLKGSEDLGGGLKAVFTFEEGVDLSDNSANQGNITPATPSSPVSSSGSRLFGRVASVGLESGFGNVRFGRDYSPYYTIWQPIDPFADGFLGKATNVAPVAGTRLDNGLYYDTPKFRGLQGRLAMQKGESTTDDPAIAVKNGGDVYSAALSYASGPWLVGYGTFRVRNATGTNRTKAHTIGGIYDFNLVKVHVLYFDGRDDARTLNARTYYAGLTVPVAPFTVIGGYGHLRDETSNGRNANYVALAVTYALSPRTNLYVSSAHFANSGNAAFVISDSSTRGLYTTANLPPGFNPTSYEFGVRVRF